jgi:hypothetical protein
LEEFLKLVDSIAQSMIPTRKSISVVTKGSSASGYHQIDPTRGQTRDEASQIENQIKAWIAYSKDLTMHGITCLT